MTTLSLIKQARSSGAAIGFEVFRGTSDEQELRLGWLVAVSLAIRPEDLEGLASQLWPDLAIRDEDVDAFARRPGVLVTEAGLRLVESWAIYLSREFQNQDPKGFKAAHRLLAEIENKREVERYGVADELEWYRRGRTAFYLAGVEAEESLDAFGSTFVDAPTFDRGATRLWLTHLVHRQAYLLDEYSSQLAFYRGFQAYVTGHFDDARSHFDKFLSSEGTQENLTAIALHLRGVLEEDSKRRTALLEEAIEQSLALDFHENLIMSRQSLLTTQLAATIDDYGDIWYLNPRERLSTAKQEPAEVRTQIESRVDRLCSEARENWNLALAEGDKSLISWTQRTLGALEWVCASSLGRELPIEDEAAVSRISELLRGAVDMGWAISEPETSLLAYNDLAILSIGQGDYWNAVEVLEDAVQDLSFYQSLYGRAVEKLKATLRTLRRHAQYDRKLTARVKAIENSL